MFFPSTQDLMLASGGLFPSTVDIKRIEPELLLAEEMLSKVVGREIVTELKERSGEDDDPVLKLCKSSLAYFTLISYADNREVVHTDSGRKILASENAKTPWQWQVQRDKHNLLNKAYQFAQLLITNLEEAKNQTFLTSMRGEFLQSLWIDSLVAFQYFYYLGDDYYIFERARNILGYIVQPSQMRVIGENLPEIQSDTTLYNYLRIMAASLTMSELLDENSLSLHKDGIVRPYGASNTNTSSASELATSEEIAIAKQTYIAKYNHFKSLLLSHFDNGVVIDTVEPIKHFSI